MFEKNAKAVNHVRSLISCVIWLPLQKVETSYTHVRSMVEFAIALMGKLELINTHSFNNFKLRIGKFAPA